MGRQHHHLLATGMQIFEMLINCTINEDAKPITSSIVANTFRADNQYHGQFRFKTFGTYVICLRVSEESTEVGTLSICVGRKVYVSHLLLRDRHACTYQHYSDVSSFTILLPTYMVLHLQIILNHFNDIKFVDKARKCYNHLIIIFATQYSYCIKAKENSTIK